MSYLILCFTCILHHSRNNRKFLSKFWYAKWVKSHFTEQHVLKNLTLCVKANEKFSDWSLSILITRWVVVWLVWSALPIWEAGNGASCQHMRYGVYYTTSRFCLYVSKNILISCPIAIKSR